MMTLILLSFITASLGHNSVPTNESGFLYNMAPDAPVKLDVYMDLLCEDSKALLPQLTSLVDSFSENEVQMKIHMFPLPYHTYSFFAAKGAYVFSKMIEERYGITNIDGMTNGNGSLITGNETAIGEETTVGNSTSDLNETAVDTISGNGTAGGNATFNGTRYDDDDDDDDDDDGVVKTSVFDWFRRVLGEMDSFKRTSVDEETLTSVLERYVSLVDEFGLDTTEFFNRLSEGKECHMDAVLTWKYGAARGVHSTPLAFINGVEVPGEDQAPSDFETIKAAIDKNLDL